MTRLLKPYSGDLRAEVWRSIPNARCYEISSRGRARSWRRRNGGRRATPRLLKVYLTGRRGHERPATSIYRKRRYICQLVALAFIGVRPKGKEVAHFDGNRFNNRPSNLVYVTHKENMAQAIEHGTVPVLTRPWPRRTAGNLGQPKERQ